MMDTEKEILDSLRELDEKTRRMATANPKPNLIPLFEKLDLLAARLPRDASRDLLHYLHNKSYQKALALLEGRGAENERGVCH